MIELGGNITLNGFEKRDYAELIVVKKIVGRYARQISDTKGSFENLVVTLNKDHYSLSAKLELKDESFEQTVTNQNLFVALDSLLKQLASQL